MILKTGTKVAFTKSYLKFLKDKSFDMCTLGGHMYKESDAYAYMVSKALGMGVKYKAKITGYRSDCYHVSVVVADKLKDDFYVEYNHVRKVK